MKFRICRIKNDLLHSIKYLRFSVPGSFKQQCVERMPLKIWLKNQDTEFYERMLKVELLVLLKQHKHHFTKYWIDTTYDAAGHSILKLPPYHSELKTIENNWGNVKRPVASYITCIANNNLPWFCKKISNLWVSSQILCNQI